MPGIDYAAVRQAIPIERVLELLKFEPSDRLGDQVRGPCPLHGSRSPMSRSFSVNLDKNVFRCFVCGTSGNQLDLWCRANKLTLLAGAADLCDRMHIPLPRPTVRPQTSTTEKRNP